MNKQAQIDLAERLGRLGRLSGRAAAAQDAALLSLLADREIGETPEGGASTRAILRAWNSGFTAQHNAIVFAQGGAA